MPEPEPEAKLRGTEDRHQGSKAKKQLISTIDHLNSDFRNIARFLRPRRPERMLCLPRRATSPPKQLDHDNLRHGDEEHDASNSRLLQRKKR